MGTNKMVEEALKNGYIVANPIEHYSIEEIKEMSVLAKKYDLILSIKKETSNFYQGTLIGLVKRTSVKQCDSFIKYL